MLPLKKAETMDFSASHESTMSLTVSESLLNPNFLL